MMCEGNSFSNGNMKPVALVRMVVIRKMAVNPGIDCDLNIPNKTTRPATIATRLITTGKTVTACKLKPSIMIRSPCWMIEDYGCSVENATVRGVDLTFGPPLVTHSLSECQIQNSTGNLYLLVVL